MLLKKLCLIKMQETLPHRAPPVSQLPGVKCHKMSGALRLDILCRNPVNEFVFIIIKYCGVFRVF